MSAFTVTVFEERRGFGIKEGGTEQEGRRDNRGGHDRLGQDV